MKIKKNMRTQKSD